jgi:hypothetical protein
MFVIKFYGLFLESFEEVDGRQEPVWSPSGAIQFDTREAAEAVQRLYPDNTTMRAAEIVEAEL